MTIIAIVNMSILVFILALHHQNQPFIPSNVKLEMSLDVTYSPSSITFKSCCKTYIYE